MATNALSSVFAGALLANHGCAYLKSIYVSLFVITMDPVCRVILRKCLLDIIASKMDSLCFYCLHAK